MSFSSLAPGRPARFLAREWLTTTLIQVALWLFLALPVPGSTGIGSGAAGASALTGAFPSAAAASQERTTRNPHGPLTVPCENCHTAAGWRPIRAVPEFDHNKTSYPLRGMHDKVKCVNCHTKPVFADVGKNCADCHADIHRRQMGPNCEQCHTVQGWNIAVQQVKDHQNRFPLLGAHAAVQCEDCHKQAATGIFFGLSTNCDSCHLKDWQNTTNPPHAADPADFPSAGCQGCHQTFDSWLGATFKGNHAAPPINFPLTAGHANVACQQCHINNNYHLQIAATDCGNAGCHLTTWQNTKNPSHASNAQAFPVANCSQCHTTADWNTSTFDHSLTGFPLTNSHRMVSNGGLVKTCDQCHIANNYTLTTQPTDCGNAGCHLTTWQNTNNPKHSTSGAPFAAANCSGCHNTISWSTATFDHSATGFPLIGAHQLVGNGGKVNQCTDCHINNNYNLTSANTDCMLCHIAAWNSTPTFGGNVPNHIVSNFPTSASACAACHTITAWVDGKFDHSTTGFPLTGGHVVGSPPPGVQQCADCHVNGNYTLTTANTDCYGCHQTAWNSTSTMGGLVPNHVSAGFPTGQCSSCHTTANWKSTWSHASTGFTLVGTHLTTPCAGCHVGNNYSLTTASADCYTCHTAAWNSTTTIGGNVPNHVAANFPQTASACTTCHPITTWSAGVFDHSTTGFPLTGGHVVGSPPPGVQQCTDCHVGGNYTLTTANTDCYGCHQTAWNSTQTMGGTVPNHVAAGFPTPQCSSCHTTTNWKSTWSHASTGFTLVGTHATTSCVLCHVSNNYSLTTANTDCMGCHLSAWNSTQTLGGNVPNHVQSNFPQTAAACSGCHTITIWADGKFDHSTTGWALTGAHQMPPAAGSKITACTDCHVGGNYALTSANTLCYGCHQAAWTSTQTLGGSVPNHIAAGYPTTCDTCHTTTSWLGATFNHTYFPIPHHGSVCNDCHQVSTNYASFTCINCHTTTAHQQSNTDNQHQGVSGYTYGPTTCYSCHKNGGGG